MRALAERLQTSTATLYRHVSGKDELMVFVVDRLLAELVATEDETSRQPPETWQEAARKGATRFRALLTRHPNMVPLLIRQVPIGPNGLAVREGTIGALSEFGFTPALAARAYTTIAHYVVGFVVQEQAPSAGGSLAAEELGDYYRGLPDDRYPFTVAAADALTGIPQEDEFVEGLEFVLAGIATLSPDL
jgi:AcrR family transcriptional regulator